MLPLLVLVVSAQAAVNVQIRGSVYSEIASEPSDVLRAGTRIQLYSELSSRLGKIRLIGLNQKYDQLNTFDTFENLRLENIIDWAEVQLQGNLFPQGPPVKLSIGNVEIDYSPYVLYLKDDALSEGYNSYLDHRGVFLHDLKGGGFESSAFVLWGFKDPLKNAIGGKINKIMGRTNITGTIVDYRYRILDADQKIIAYLARMNQKSSELEWDRVQSIHISQDLTKSSSLSLFIAKQDKNTFHRFSNGQIDSSKQLNALREYEFKTALAEQTNFTLGYRDVPLEYDPTFRQRTPEFDPINGKYLGYNPTDRYRDRLGYYAKMNTGNDNVQMNIKLEAMKDHKLLATNFLGGEISFHADLSNFEIDFFSKQEQVVSWLNTGIRNMVEESFTRLIVAKPLSNISLKPGFEFRNHNKQAGIFREGTFFVIYNPRENFILDGGVRMAFSERSTKGKYWGIKYQAPNGIEFLYRHTNPSTESNIKKMYDPDYRLREPENIAQASIKIVF